MAASARLRQSELAKGRIAHGAVPPPPIPNRSLTVHGARAVADRPRIPLQVKLDACLLLLGFTREEVRAKGKAIEWHHTPALGLREQREENGRTIYTPDANDPGNIVPMRKADHHKQTNGTKATTAGSDKHAIAKAARIRDQQAEFRRNLLRKGEPERKRAKTGWKGHRRMQAKPKWPKRKMGRTRK